MAPRLKSEFNVSGTFGGLGIFGKAGASLDAVIREAVLTLA
jgi:hypothetical protein